MKKILCVLVSVLVIQSIMAQQKPVSETVVNTTEKVNKKTQELSQASDKAAQQLGQAGDNAKVIVDNAKKILRVFEPILNLHFRKKKASGIGQESYVLNTTPVDTKGPSQPVVEPVSANAGGASVPTPPAQMAYDARFYENYVPENGGYNSDGTANWGNQYNGEFGNYLDAFSGTILDGGTAEDKPESVDLIFLAPNDGQNAYYIITPNFARDNYAADAYWGSATTDNPVKSWKAVNESEVALTTITGQQFEKIQYSEQLRGAVKQSKGFASFFSSTNKLEGRVFAVKTEMHGRTAYALIYIVKHIGTSGSSGHLKVKIKCTGFDTSGDGNPDPALYIR